MSQKSNNNENNSIHSSASTRASFDENGIRGGGDGGKAAGKKGSYDEIKPTNNKTGSSNNLDNNALERELTIDSQTQRDPRRYNANEPTESFGEPLNVSLNNATIRYRSIRRSLSKPLTLDQAELGGGNTLFDLSAWLRNKEEVPDEKYAKRLGLVFDDLYVRGSPVADRHIHTFVTMFYHIIPTIKHIGLGAINGVRSVFGGRPVGVGEGKLILEDITGFCSEGEMLLVLGQPGSGCSTLLRVLGNERKTYSKIDGEVTYGGISPEEMYSKYRGEIAYNQEEDRHYATLSVRKTLGFAIECKMPSRRVVQNRSAFRTELLDAVIDMFGLRGCADTVVGDAFVRGCSGGERKRVSIAEQIVTGAAVNVWDGSTRGLDSSSALDYVRSLRVSTDMLKKTTVVTLYQASENIYKLFDKVLVLDKGRCLYFGPADHAVEYFDKLGIYKPPRLTTSDFLTGVTQLHERQVKEGYENIAPKTADEFAAAFKASTEYAEAKSEIRSYESRVENEHPGQNFREIVQESKMGAGKSKLRRRSPYTTTFSYQFMALLKREWLLVWGNIPLLVFRYIYNIAFAIIVGTLFFRLPTTSDGAFTRGGTIFFTILFNSLSAQAEIPKAITGRQIVYKHKGLALYHPSAYLLAQVIVDIPFMALQIILFSCILYWVCGLYATAGHFFTFMLITFFTALCLTAYFRFVASVSPNTEIAHTISGISLLFLIMYAGYLIPYPSMHPWFIWIYWINPIAYGISGLVANEFSQLKLECSGAQLVPRGPGYTDIANQVCTLQGAKPGVPYVMGSDYAYAGYRIDVGRKWVDFVAVLCFWLLFVLLTAVINEFVQYGGEGYTINVFKKRVKPVPEVPEDTDEFDKKARERSAPTDEEILNGTMYMWKNIDYVVPVKGGERKLLDKVNGYVKPGTLTALMGSSGAGKTTLLDVLAQRKTIGKIDGEMLINGIAPPKSFQRVTGYCEQLDVHNPHSTVRESLRFAAYLRQPFHVSKEQKDKDVERVIKLLGLEGIGNAMIGDPDGKLGISLEERKRLTIAVELVAKPKILFLDEPTSGLDAQAAFNIVHFLRRLAATGETILCTIHQPSSILFEHFDRLLLLARGGHTTYFGDIGKDAKTLISYFERNGGPKCSPDANPAEYILDIVGSSQNTTNWAEIWNNSPEAQDIVEEIERLRELEASSGSHQLSENDNAKFATPDLYQIRTVFRRMLLTYWRDYEYNLTRVALQIMSALIIGFSFFNLSNDVVDLQNKVFTVFQSSVIGVLIINQIQPQFVRQRLWYSREASTNQYGWKAFAFAIIFAEWPFAIFASTLYVVCLYWTSGLNSLSDRTGYFYLMYITLTIFSVTLGQAIIAFVPNDIIAALLNPIFTSFMLLFCGVTNPYPTMPKFWRSWMYWLTPIRYFVEGVVTNELYDLDIVCKPEQFYVFQPPSDQTCGDYAADFLKTGPGYLKNPDASSDCQYCPFKVGQEYFVTLDWDFANRYRNFGIMLAFLVFNCLVVTFFIKVYKVNKR
ncbi:ATP-binding cassette transporter snq2 [Mycoemilia scoparia]|uniref:ATP-binding cassette transporter snq2 n=1 Tax=Mycoemilia scoparia TaxID=417184 RepID=A0A9W8DPB6_9FUNG|nr:ATP-binding cassette transporter snq2 [Mycoemilia scoparia]